MILFEMLILQQLHNISDDKLEYLVADSAYRSKKLEELLKLGEYTSHIHEKGCRSKPLSKGQKAENYHKSRTTVRVEHIFGSWVNEMGGKIIRLIGKVCNAGAIGLKNLTYNMKRYAHLESRCT